MVDYSVKLSLAMAALLRKLSNRIAFDYPPFEPYLFFDLFALRISYAKRTPTRITPPPLFAIAIKTISFDLPATTPGTLLFLIIP